MVEQKSSCGTPPKLSSLKEKSVVSRDVDRNAKSTHPLPFTILPVASGNPTLLDLIGSPQNARLSEQPSTEGPKGAFLYVGPCRENEHEHLELSGKNTNRIERAKILGKCEWYYYYYYYYYYY